MYLCDCYMFRRNYIDELHSRLQEDRQFIQVLKGPRQVGKTSIVRQLMIESNLKIEYYSADNVAITDSYWIQQIWLAARLQLEQEKLNELVIIIDKIQKIPNWAEVIKKYWDEDTVERNNIKLILLGSSTLMLQQGLTESLMGRFETIYVDYWTYNEMHNAFGFNELQYAWFGGYPGAAKMIENENRWKDYIRDSVIETVISKDILMLIRVDKPALLRRVFELSVSYSGQILSYSKIVGQLQDAGNTTTVSHYLDLLSVAGMVTGLEKFYSESIRQRASSPKLQVLNTALFAALQNTNFESILKDPIKMGRVIESVIGMHLMLNARSGRYQVYYWREADDEVDFVLKRDDQVIAIEVKSGASRPTRGMYKFSKKYPEAKILLMGIEGIIWKDFIKLHPEKLFDI